MKKIIAFFLVVVTVCSFAFSLYAMPTEISAQAAVLIAVHNGELLYSKNADKRLPMASTTKIMTAITVIENCDINRVVTIPKEACGIEGSSAYLKEGEKLTVKELLYALMLASANDSAVALAIAISGSCEAFVELMNSNAKELDLKNTHFVNPHGLDDAQHYSSANDLAKIMIYAMKNPIFREITNSKSYVCTSKGNEERVFSNHNKLLNMYKPCVGGKTGFTKRCGRSLVSYARSNKVEIVCVTLNAPDDWNDHVSLYNSGFDMFEHIDLILKDEHCYELPVVNGEKDYVKAIAEPCSVIINKNAESCIKAERILKRFYYAGIEKGECLGYTVFYQNGKEIAKSRIISEETVYAIKYKTLFQRILSVFVK